MRLFALVTPYIHPLNEIFRPSHRYSLLYPHFSRIRHTLYLILYILVIYIFYSNLPYPPTDEWDPPNPPSPHVSLSSPASPPFFAGGGSASAACNGGASARDPERRS